MPVNVCVLCKSSFFKVDGKATDYVNLVDPFKLVKCLKCGMRWLNPQPTAGEYKTIYGQAYFTQAEDIAKHPGLFSAFGPPPHANHSEHLQRYQRVWKARLHRLQNLRPRGQTLFEVGAGTGSFLALAREQRWEVFGIDVSEYACREAMARHNINLECVDLHHYTPSHQGFDVVCLNHVFEHFTQPIEALAKLRDLMKPESLLVMELPNSFHSLVERIMSKRPEFKRQPRSLYSIHHPYFYGLTQLRALMERHGFRVIEARTHIPEFWRNNIRGRIGRVIDFLGDIFGGHGYCIEIIACKK